MASPKLSVSTTLRCWAEEASAVAVGSCIAGRDAVCLSQRSTDGEELSQKSAHCVRLTLADAYRQLEREGAQLGAGLLRSSKFRSIES